MAGFNDTWQVWWKGSEGDYVELSTFSPRNIVGSALASVSAPGSEYGEVHPGVLRFTVEEINAGQARVTSRIIQSADEYHPDLSTLGVWVSLGMPSLSLFTGAYVTISTNAQAGDTFEIAEGYSWDAVNERWITQRAFGILLQGEFGNVHTMKVKNISDRPHVYVSVAWQNSGTTQIMQAREIEGIWKAPSESPILVTGPDGILGYMTMNDEIEIEFRPSVPDSMTGNDNPILIEVSISGEAI